MTKSKKSTGPISTKGKAISSRNSITHGLTSRKWIKEDEKDLYQKALDGFREDFDPKSSIEELLNEIFKKLAANLVFSKELA